MLRRVVAVLTMVLLSVSVTKAQNVINGAGATFPYPLISKWSSEYQKIKPNVRINYQAIGSGGGIRQLIAGTVNFGASDAPMTEEQLADAKKAHGDVIHIPETLGAVVVVYNLPGVTTNLKFDGGTIADIYLGKISTWNDSRIKSLNPGVNLPDTRIVVVHRADGSGTTYIFADYLSKVSPEWSAKVGRSTSLDWPAGIGGKGNDGVAGQVSRTPGAIGYVELIYALQNNISFADIKNAAGVFVHPSIPGVTEALANAAKTLPEDLRFSITNAPGKKSYPISSATWFLVYKEQSEYSQAKDVLEFMKWAVTEGQKYSANLDYAPLPVKIQKLNIAKLKTVTFNGGSIL
ncbi:MAG: phosphate ABC transporter substrate-binding protein PstS, partial [Bacteroidetes bacterium]|nr:phosphate ABC transporter substrate-binding protein PstS [Bacteroidota bacterium]